MGLQKLHQQLKDVQQEEQQLKAQVHELRKKKMETLKMWCNHLYR